MSAVVFIAAIFAAPTAMPTADFEAFRSGIRVEYLNGNVIEMKCTLEMVCSLTILSGGKVVEVPADAMQGIIVIPEDLALLKVGRDGEMIVASKADCAEYSERPPASDCLVEMTIKDAHVASYVTRKRTESFTYGVPLNIAE